METLLIVLAAAVLLMSWLPGKHLPERAMRFMRIRRYVSGEVLAVDKVSYGRGTIHGVHLLLKTAEGKLSVRLGPSWFVDNQRMKVAAHDLIKVAGSRVIYDGKPALIATLVRKGDDRLRLRTDSGIPLWLLESRPAPLERLKTP